MKKKHKIKTINDIKYCEEHQRVIWDDVQSDCYYKFDGNVWSLYKQGKLSVYNASVYITKELYYEEEKEQLEATNKDVGKLCWFWNDEESDDDWEVGILKDIDYDEDELKYLSDDEYWRYHCRPLTKEEIKEFMEKAE